MQLSRSSSWRKGFSKTPGLRVRTTRGQPPAYLHNDQHKRWDPQHRERLGADAPRGGTQRRPLAVTAPGTPWRARCRMRAGFAAGAAAGWRRSNPCRVQLACRRWPLAGAAIPTPLTPPQVLPFAVAFARCSFIPGDRWGGFYSRRRCWGGLAGGLRAARDNGRLPQAQRVLCKEEVGHPSGRADGGQGDKGDAPAFKAQRPPCTWEGCRWWRRSCVWVCVCGGGGWGGGGQDAGAMHSRAASIQACPAASVLHVATHTAPRISLPTGRGHPLTAPAPPRTHVCGEQRARHAAQRTGGIQHAKGAAAGAGKEVCHQALAGGQHQGQAEAVDRPHRCAAGQAVAASERGGAGGPEQAAGAHDAPAVQAVAWKGVGQGTHVRR